MTEVSRKMQIALVASLCIVFAGLLIHQVSLFGSDEANLKYTAAAALCLLGCFIPLRSLIRRGRRGHATPVERKGHVEVVENE